MENPNGKYLYKYRNLENFERLVDIIVNKRLFGATFDSLNDPMEGFFKYQREINTDKIEELRNAKGIARICSLFKDYANDLLWSFYANGHRSCCIELIPTADSWQRYDVRYDRNIPNAQKCGFNTSQILSTKSLHWEHEQEVRYIKYLGRKKQQYYLPISINRILIGLRMPDNMERLIRKLVEKVDEDIKVVKIKKEQISFEYE